jgi:uncharacterized protein (DUF1697 family)
MDTWIALLRGINVGGKNLLPMRELRALLEKLGLENVRTYVQSGNCVFECDKKRRSKLDTKIADEIEAEFGFRPEILIIDKDDLDAAIRNNPFPEGENNPKSVHLFFLSRSPKKPDLSKLEALRSSTERFSLSGRVFFLYAPEGVGRSKLAAQVEKSLGVSLTARNLRSVLKIAELVD